MGMGYNTINEQILAELKRLNENFSNYYREWQEHQTKHDDMMNAAKGTLQSYEKMTKNMKPEDLEQLAKILSSSDMKEMMKTAARMWEDKLREDAEFQKKLKGIK